MFAFAAHRRPFKWDRPGELAVWYMERLHFNTNDERRVRSLLPLL